MSFRAVNDRHVKDEKSGSSHQAFHVKEPFTRTGVIKPTKLLSFFKKKTQVDEFTRVKTFFILILRNEKVFHVKDVNKSVP